MTLEETGKEIGGKSVSPKPASFKGYWFEGSTFPYDPYRTIHVGLNSWMLTEYLPAMEIVLAGRPKGFKLLVTAMAHVEGFIGGNKPSKSYRTKNPGNIGNTDSGATSSAKTLEEGIQRQINYIERIIAGKNDNYPMGKIKSIPPSPKPSPEIAVNPKSYGLTDGYLPGYKFLFTGQIDQFVKIYATFPRINNNYIDTIVSYFGQNGLIITPESRIGDIIEMS